MALSSVIACGQVSSDDVALWKTTEKGPGKLADALRSRSVDPRIRAEAAVALVDIGKADEVDGVLAAMPANERWDVFKVLVPLYITAARAPAPERSLVYRDALFSARALAQPEDRQRIDAALLPSVQQELRSGRVRNGRHSTEKILTAIGAPAGEMLAGLLGEPIIGYAAAADLLAKIGDEGAREKGAQSLIARAKRDRPVPEPLWKAIGVLGGPGAVKFLREKIETGNREEAANAVRALQQRREPAVLAFALKVAGDPKADRAIRDEMFGVAESIGGLEARDGLVRIIQADKEELVRYRAFESLLAVAKQDGIVPGLEAFPPGAPYKKTDVEDLLVKLIEKLGPAARPSLIKALDSRSPLARVTAVLSLEQVGQPADAPALEKVGKDATPLKGFGAGETVGKQALRAAGVVKQRASRGN